MQFLIFVFDSFHELFPPIRHIRGFRWIRQHNRIIHKSRHKQILTNQIKPTHKHNRTTTQTTPTTITRGRERGRRRGRGRGRGRGNGSVSVVCVPVCVYVYQLCCGCGCEYGSNRCELAIGVQEELRFLETNRHKSGIRRHKKRRRHTRTRPTTTATTTTTTKRKGTATT